MIRPSKAIRDTYLNIKENTKRNKSPKQHLNYTQFQIIRYLIDNDKTKICQKDLEIETKLTKASMSSALSNLEELGLIKRVQSKDDKRVNYIEITAKVKDMKKDMEKDISVVDKKMVEGISKEDLDTFYKVLEKMNKNLEKE